MNVTTTMDSVKYTHTHFYYVGATFYHIPQMLLVLVGLSSSRTTATKADTPTADWCAVN